MGLPSGRDAIVTKLPMRITVRLDPDIAAAVALLRRERSFSLTEALNELARTGLARREAGRFKQRTAPVGLRANLHCIGEALERLESAQLRTGSR